MYVQNFSSTLATHGFVFFAFFQVYQFLSVCLSIPWFQNISGLPFGSSIHSLLCEIGILKKKKKKKKKKKRFVINIMWLLVCFKHAVPDLDVGNRIYIFT